MEHSLQPIEHTAVRLRHVAFTTWNHLEPHGALRHVMCQVETSEKPHIARPKPFICNNGSMCAMCAMCFPYQSVRVNIITRESPSNGKLRSEAQWYF